jgi:hypothetical protein
VFDRFGRHEIKYKRGSLLKDPSKGKLPLNFECRVSIDRQNHESLLREYCVRRDWKAGEEIPDWIGLCGQPAVARWTWRSLNNVALVAPGQGIGTSAKNPAAQLQLNVLTAVAELERSIVVERVNSGLAIARAKGVRLGRPPTLIPYWDEMDR